MDEETASPRPDGYVTPRYPALSGRRILHTDTECIEWEIYQPVAQNPQPPWSDIRKFEMPQIFH